MQREACLHTSSQLPLYVGSCSGRFSNFPLEEAYSITEVCHVDPQIKPFHLLLLLLLYMAAKGLTYKTLLHTSNIPLSTSNHSRLSVQYLSTLSVFPYSAPFTPHLSLCPPSQGQRGPSRHAEDSSAPIRRRRALVSIKWYVLMPQITDTCSFLPSHPVAVASLLHHLMQRNHPHYLMRPYCTHKLSFSPPPHFTLP